MKLSERGNLYVAYGSNMNLAQMERRCPGAVPVAKGFIPNHALTFRGHDFGAVATVEPCVGSQVPVLLWNLTPAHWQALDRYESYPDFYDCRIVNIDILGEKHTAGVYIMNDGFEIGAPSEHYLNVIREGYRDAGFDLAKLEKTAAECAEFARESHHVAWGDLEL